MHDNTSTAFQRHDFAPVRTGVSFSVTGVAFSIVVLTILFPYVRVLPLNTDTQPNFLLAMILFGPLLQKVRRSDVLALLGIILLLLLYTLADPRGSAFRAWASYITPILVLLFTRAYLSNELKSKTLDKLMVRSFYLWVGFGWLQYLSGSQIVQLTFRASTSEDRGWMAFAGEPSAYGTILFLFAAYFAFRKKLMLPLIAFVTAVLVCQSAVALLYFVILALSYGLIFMGRYILLLPILGMGMVGVSLVVDLNEVLAFLPDGSRLAFLVRNATIEGGLESDSSIASRVGDLVITYQTLTEGSFFGNGIGGDIRIKSGWGAYVFQLGWVGLFLAAAWIGYFLYKSVPRGRNALASNIAIIGMMFSSTPLSMPMATFVMAVLIFYRAPRTAPLVTDDELQDVNSVPARV